jgi:hypothetical protein
MSTTNQVQMAIQSQFIQFQVERLAETQPHLRADDWRSPLIYRLLKARSYQDSKANVDLLANMGPNSKWILQLQWQGLAQDFELCLNSYQEPVLTEFAALGVCCIALYRVAERLITRVTRRGQKADYWIGNDECLLEVSGQQSGNLETLRDEKKAQLLDNPMDKPGYVSVTNFAGRRSYLYYYKIDGSQP